MSLIQELKDIAAGMEFDQFEEYLKANPDLKFERADSCRCPIATWLKHKHKEGGFVKSGFYVRANRLEVVKYYDQEGRTVTASTISQPWVQRFIDAVDNVVPTLPKGNTITGREALRVLRRLR